MAGEELIRMASLDGRSNFPEHRLDLRCTNVLVHCRDPVNQIVAAVEDV